MIKQLPLLSIYAITALLVTALWTDKADTEVHENRYNSVVAIADGTAPIPFVRRRLVFDVARAIDRAVPGDTWRAIESNPMVTRVADGLDWPRDRLPILMTTTALIGLSAFGFMIVARWIIARLYRSPEWLPDFAGLALGFMLMGGGGDGHYQWYPYDVPHAFVFALTLAGFLAKRPWAYLTFAAACYSKETAFTLILARWLLLEDRRSWRPYPGLAAMLAFFAFVQYRLQVAYSSDLGEGFWMFERNLKMLSAFFLFNSWLALLIAICAIRFRKVWADFPWQLRRLSAIPFLLLFMAIFKGWLEELRQYGETLPIFGPMLFQWALIELGLGHLMVPREAGPVTLSGLPGEPDRPN